MKISPIVDRDGITALRELHDLLPDAPLTAVLDLAEWLIAVATGPFAVLHPDIARRIQTEPEFLGRLIQLISAPSAEAGLGDKKPILRVATPVVADGGAGTPASGVPENYNAPWGPEDDAVIRVMRAKRYSRKEIGDRLGRGCDAVRRRAYEAGIIGREPSAVDVSGKADAEMGGSEAPRRGVPWTDREDAKLLGMRADRHAWSAIARQLGRTTKSVAARFYLLNRHAPFDPGTGAEPARSAPTAQPTAKSDSVASASKPAPVEKTESKPASGGHKAWTEAEDAKLQRMREAGHTWGVIASQLNRTIRSVQQRGARLNAALSKNSAPTAEIARPAAKPKSGVPAPRPAPVKKAPPTHPVSADSEQADQIERIRAHLDRMPYEPKKFGPHIDLRIASDILNGVPTVLLAEQLSISKKDILKRFSAMIPADLRNGNGRFPPEAQSLLLRALILNAKEDAANSEAAE